jgi:hypothetical protein
MRNVFKQFAIALMLTVGVALTLGAATATAQAATPETKRVSVTGEIVDTWCNVTMIMFAEGSGHYQCAVWCAAGGIPVSIKDEDENVYVVLKVEGEESNVAAPSILRIQAHQVTVEGDLIERDGVKYLLVSQVANDDGIVNLSHEDVGIQPFGK